MDLPQIWKETGWICGENERVSFTIKMGFIPDKDLNSLNLVGGTLAPEII
jgi:hypothetical protein